MWKKIGRLIKNIGKFILARLPFLRSMELLMNFKRYYKRNFGRILFQGQSFQDLIAFLYLKNIKKGFYIDIGANDGILASNTYIFEKIGWEGICVEPQLDIFKMLKKYRKCDCYNVAISSENNTVDFLKATASEFSALYNGISESHKESASKYGKTRIVKVKTITFDEMMANYPNVKHIDFMTLDVEGHEISILETINFQKYTFGLLTIEKNNPEKIRNIMQKNGYKLFMEIGPDLMFIPE